VVVRKTFKVRQGYLGERSFTDHFDGFIFIMEIVENTDIFEGSHPIFNEDFFFRMEFILDTILLDLNTEASGFSTWSKKSNLSAS